MEELFGNLSNFKSIGAFGLVLIIFALAIRSMLLIFSRSLAIREERNFTLFKETLEVIREHRNVLEKQTERIDLEKRAIINQIRRSESNIRNLIDKKREKD